MGIYDITNDVDLYQGRESKLVSKSETIQVSQLISSFPAVPTHSGVGRLWQQL